MRCTFALFPVLLIALFLTGCNPWELPQQENKAVPTSAPATEEASAPPIIYTQGPTNPAYPQKASLGKDLDILVMTEEQTIRMVNRTPQSYGPVQLWLNQQWSANVAKITIGTENVVDLGLFFNQHNEPYPSGDFFHPDRAVPIVLVEIFDPATGLRHRLVARRTGI